MNLEDLDKMCKPRSMQKPVTQDPLATTKVSSLTQLADGLADDQKKVNTAPRTSNLQMQRFMSFVAPAEC